MDYIYLFFSSFVSASLIPIGSEALLLYDLSIELNTYILFIVASIGNTLGSFINYYLGLKGKDYIVNKNIIKPQRLEKTQVYFNKYGGYSLLLAWVPIIGDPITFIAGIAKYDFKKFMIIVFISKSSRYLFLIYSYFYISNLS